MMRASLIAIAGLALVASGCVATVGGTTTTDIDLKHGQDDMEMVSLRETAKVLNLDLEEAAFWGDSYAHSPGTRSSFLIKANYSKYWYNGLSRDVEYPGVVWDHNTQDIYFPLGMFNSMCKDVGRLDAMRQLRRTSFDKDYKPLTVKDIRRAPIEAEPAKKAPVEKNMPAAMPLTGLKVMIDAGHGGKDPGGIGVTGIQEKEIALDVSLRIQKLLKEQGATVFMTRTNDSYPELSDRASLANSKKCDIFVSIHANIAFNSEVTGAETWYKAGGERGTASERLAEDINSALVKSTKANDRGARADQRGLRVLLETNMPAVLVELGFMSNAEEAKKLGQSKYRDLCAEGVVTGVKNWAAKNWVSKNASLSR